MLLMCVQDTSDLLTGSANGYYVGQIFYDAFQGRFHHGGGGIVLLGIPMFAMFFCGMSSVISNSRRAPKPHVVGEIPTLRITYA